MTATPNEMTCTTPAKRGWGQLPCPCCGEAEVYVQAQLDCLTADDAFHCASCDQDFGHNFVRDLLAKWAPVLRWIDLCPELPAE